MERHLLRDLPKSRLFGHAHLIDKPPESVVLTDAIIVPFQPNLQSFVYVRGIAQPLTNLVRFVNEMPFNTYCSNAKETNRVGDIGEVVIDEAIYGGFLFTHYGHFLLETLPRLQHQESLPANLPVVINASLNAADAMRMNPFVPEILTAACIDPKRLLVARKRVLVKRLYVPIPLFIIRYACSETFVAWTRDIGARLLASLQTEMDNANSRILLSRKRVASSGQRVAHQDLIEEVAKNKGFDIIYPESMSIAEQVARLASAAHVVAYAGSALHTLLFVAPRKRITIFTGEKHLNANIKMISDVREDDARVIFLDESENHPSMLSRILEDAL